MKLRTLMLAVLLLSASAWGQTSRLPIIDMHMHASTPDGPSTPTCPGSDFQAWDPAVPFSEYLASRAEDPPCEAPVWSAVSRDELIERTVTALEERNVIAVVSGPPMDVAAYVQAAPDRFLRGQLIPPVPGLERLRQFHEMVPLDVIGEVVAQYGGVLPGDELLEPMWAFAEEADIPVGIHVGLGPPGTRYREDREGWQNYRVQSPLAMEEVMARHPKLRVYVMHAGWPMIDDIIALLYAHPQVYVDIAVLNWGLPREEFYRYLERIVQAGLASRVMYGSDQGGSPEIMATAIEAIESAPFLNDQQKRDILYYNAARFLRLSDEDIARHHAM